MPQTGSTSEALPDSCGYKMCSTRSIRLSNRASHLTKLESCGDRLCPTSGLVRLRPLMKLQPASASHPIEPDWQEQVDDFIGDQQSAENGQGHRRQNLAADPRGEHHGKDG